MEKFTCKWVF